MERTFLTTEEGRRVITQIPVRLTVEAPSLRNALLEFVARENGRILGTVTESEQRAVCTAWCSGRLYLLVGEQAADQAVD